MARGKIFIRTKKWKNGFQKESNAQLIGSWIERVMLIFGRKVTKKSEGFHFNKGTHDKMVIIVSPINNRGRWWQHIQKIQILGILQMDFYLFQIRNLIFLPNAIFRKKNKHSLKTEIYISYFFQPFIGNFSVCLKSRIFSSKIWHLNIFPYFILASSVNVQKLHEHVIGENIYLTSRIRTSEKYDVFLHKVGERTTTPILFQTIYLPRCTLMPRQTL